MDQEQTTFRSGAVQLAGTVARPSAGLERPGPAALLITGSGPLDRDADAKRMPLGVSRLLAAALADAGVTTLRYDKRGVGASDGDHLAAGLSDNIEDAAAALEHLRTLPGVDPDRVVVIGHSEGALIALDLAATGFGLAGAVLLAGSAVTGEDILAWQASQLEEMLPRPVAGLLRLLRVDIEGGQRKRRAKIAASESDTMRIQGIKLNARWFREFMAFDPAPRLRDAKVPLLAITGGEDMQVDPDDIERMHQIIADVDDRSPDGSPVGSPRFEGHVLHGVNHILRRGDGSPKSYRTQLDQPLDQRLIDVLTDWLARSTGPQPAPGRP